MKLRTAEDIYNEVLESESISQRIEVLESWRIELLKEAIEVCDAHSESGCFDKEGAEANLI